MLARGRNFEIVYRKADNFVIELIFKTNLKKLMLVTIMKLDTKLVDANDID